MCCVLLCNGGGGGGQKAGRANNNKTAAAKSNDQYQADQTLYVVVSPSHSVCHSICLAVAQGKTDAVFIEGLSPASQPADRKWPYIGFCLHSGCLISFPLSSPLSSLRAVSTATVFCFPRWQEEREIGVQNEKAGLGGGAGWEMRARAYESGTRKNKRAE